MKKFNTNYFNGNEYDIDYTLNKRRCDSLSWLKRGHYFYWLSNS